MKKITTKVNPWVFAVIVLVVILLVTAVYNSFSAKKPNHDVSNQPAEHITLSAKTDGYDDMADMESNSDIIVIGSKTYENPPNIKKDEMGYLSYIFTMSDFKVEQVIKNSYEQVIPETIPVFENEGYDEQDNKTYHIAGYNKMITGNKYILYLKKADAGYYIPMGVTFGKIPLTQNEIQNSTIASRTFNQSDTQQERVMKEVLERYSSEIS